jgi:hypothetical protein
MLRKTLLAASLALLAFVAAKPAAATPVFLEPYGDIFGARTFLSSPADARPKDALQTQESKKENPTRRFIAQGFVRDADLFFLGGGGIAYADGSRANNPWSVGLNVFNVSPDGFGGDEIGFDISGKFVLWQPANRNLPVVSVVGRYLNISDAAERFDVLVAADQRLSDNLYLTANLGYGHVDYDVAGVDSDDDFVPGIGLTWNVMPRLSISGNYIIKNDAEVFNGGSGEDFWSIAGTYTFSEMFAARVGGGKHGTVFLNLIGKWD